MGTDSALSLQLSWSLHRFDAAKCSVTLSRVASLPWVPRGGPSLDGSQLQVFGTSLAVALDRAGNLYVFNSQDGTLLRNTSIQAQGGAFAQLNTTHLVYVDHSLAPRQVPSFPRVCNDNRMYPFFPLVLIDVAAGKRTMTGASTNQNLGGLVGVGNNLYAFRAATIVPSVSCSS
jgi:hypothetical protein